LIAAAAAAAGVAVVAGCETDVVMVPAAPALAAAAPAAAPEGFTFLGCRTRSCVTTAAAAANDVFPVDGCEGAVHS
jgi:hypothetical protein